MFGCFRLFVLVSVLGLSVDAAYAAGPLASERQPVAKADQLLDAPVGLRTAFTEARMREAYDVTRTTDDKSKSVYEAINHAYDLRFSFEAEGMVVTPLSDKKQAWKMRMTLRGYGYEDSEMVSTDRLTHHTTVHVNGNRVEYRHTLGTDGTKADSDLATASKGNVPIVEWYVNDARGLEQGFTITSAPKRRGSSSSPLRLELGIEGNTTAKLSDSGAIQFVDNQGKTVLRYSQLHVFDATGRELPAQIQLCQSSAVVIVINDQDAQYPITIDPLFDTEVKITASDAAEDDSFGASVAISGDTAIVGASDDNNAGRSSGSAYIFQRNTFGSGSWREVAKLTAFDAAEFDVFGFSVSISNDVAIVGAPGSDFVTYNAGSAYVFQRNQGGADKWGEVAHLAAFDVSLSANFGYSVSISGNTAIVGARFDDSNFKPGSGSAYIYNRYNGGIDNWGMAKKITPSDAASDDWFGYSVSISGNSVIVGAILNDDGGSGSGSAYIFERNRGGDNQWGEVNKLTASDADLGDFFGQSVSIDGRTAIVGAWGDDDDADISGSAYIFVRNSGFFSSWHELTKLTASDAAENGFFGGSVSISSDIAIVGAPFSAIAYAGSAYIYQRNEGGTDNWGEVSKLTASDSEAGDTFGYSVAISGNTVIVGASGNDGGGSDFGAAYIFVSLCGDGSVDSGEECDDSNMVLDDGCDADCFIEFGACCMETFCSEVTQVDCEDDGGSFLGYDSDCGMYDAEPGVIGGGSNPCAQLIEIDFKPGGCPNSHNPRSKGVVSIAIVGSPMLDVSLVDLDSLTLVRADGVGGVSLPIVRRIGAGAMIEDVSTPSGGVPCVCNDLGSDGIDDLTLKFWTGDLNRSLLLDGEHRDAEVELLLRGSLIDGTAIEGAACVVIKNDFRVWDISSSRRLKK